MNRSVRGEGRDGAPRRPRRVPAAQGHVTFRGSHYLGSARWYAGGDIAARCPTMLRFMGSFHDFGIAHRAKNLKVRAEGRDGAPRRPRRVPAAQGDLTFRGSHYLGSARWYAGGDIAARCPYHSGSWKAFERSTLTKKRDRERIPGLLFE